MNIVIHHNPDCGTSRNVLAIIEAAGYQPTVIEYLKTGWTVPQLLGLFAAASLTPRTALRTTKSPAAEQGIVDPAVNDVEIIAAMIAHPILVNRPIVCTPKGVRLCRPSVTVLGLLEKWPPRPFLKEDGSVLIDAERHPRGGLVEWLPPLHIGKLVLRHDKLFVGNRFPMQHPPHRAFHLAGRRRHNIGVAGMHACQLPVACVVHIVVPSAR